MPGFEYAPSSRSTCQHCHKKIKKKEIRMTYLAFTEEGYRQKKCFHPKCFIRSNEGRKYKHCDNRDKFFSSLKMRDEDWLEDFLVKNIDRKETKKEKKERKKREMVEKSTVAELEEEETGKKRRRDEGGCKEDDLEVENKPRRSKRKRRKRKLYFE